MNNHVSRFWFNELDIKGRYVRLESEWQLWQQNRHYTHASTELLGACAAFLSLVAVDVKTPGKLTVQLRGQGSVKTLVVQCDLGHNELKLRGMIEAPQLTTTDELRQDFKGGDMALTLFNQLTQTSYQSIVPISSDRITLIFSDYLSQSVQQPTLLWLVADQKQMSGLLLEKMPDADLKDPDGWQRITHLANTLSIEELTDCSLNELLHRLFHEEQIELYESIETSYDCPDEREKVTHAIQSIGRDECEKIISEEGKLIISNDLCNRSYVFSLSDIQAIFGVPTKH